MKNSQYSDRKKMSTLGTVYALEPKVGRGLELKICRGLAAILLTTALGCNGSGGGPEGGSGTPNKISGTTSSITNGTGTTNNSSSSNKSGSANGSGTTSNSGTPNNSGTANGSGTTNTSDTAMSFFASSRGLGKGGNFGGLEGADAHCRALATEAGSTRTQWFAYLSTASVNAKDRIGTGPWYNSKGVKIADSVAHLHQNRGVDNALNYENTLDEKGGPVPGRDQKPAGATLNEHDIVTGSTIDGEVVAGSTCADWTSDAPTGVNAMVGHSDKTGPSNRIEWNSTHTSSGCAEGRSTGGIGSGGGRASIYCFARD